MRIEHIAIWAKDLEQLKTFYTKYFGCKAGDKYINPKKNFESYFLSFESGSRIEIMEMPGIKERNGNSSDQFTGLVHFAISVGSKEKVDSLTETLRTDGYEIVGEPRTTGDGYYESVVCDPEQNRIEITI
jgi:lactoylglutathione lyase